MSGLGDVAEALENPAPVSGLPEVPPASRPPDGSLPEDCPVTPLGVAGQIRYYSDELEQLQGLLPREHTANGIAALYGRKTALLREHWPKKNENGEVTGWQSAAAAQALMQAAAEKGVWSPKDRVRGPGAWPGKAEGDVILHCGDLVLAGDEWRPCGMIGRHLYPAHPPTPRPSKVFAPGGPNGPGAELLNLFRSWNWRRADVDPELLVGGIGCQMMGGVLRWRPTIWICGEPGHGKTELLNSVHKVHGDGGAIATADATEAGLRQSLRFSSLPVIFDELEPGEDSQKAKGVIALARRASSGSLTLRGSAGHVEHEFVVRSTFVFSSVLMPPLTSAERSRIAVLDLMPLGGGAALMLDQRRLLAIGEALRHRLLQQWRRFPAALAAYRDALMRDGGHDARGADLYGTLLACMDLMLHDRSGFEPGEIETWAAKLPKVGGGESLDVDEPDHVRCLMHLLSAQIDAHGSGVRRTIGHWVEQALDGGSTSQANDILETLGVKVARFRDQRGFFVATSHAGLSRIFADTHWSGGGSRTAPWSQALRRFPGAEIGPAQRFAGMTSKTTWLPEAAIRGHD